ncbi:hypothetical protein E2K93_17335 [Thalassotalea sp. HSM 43]|uniref:hypothetical protein n=1 Tax=Thalassotalea sp. HSM 43 TaxID=2552945 RepID=UPI0010800699|nr:hypothetical protein [Thalassotalea sp. HSM 43]QBY06017.1 hypothetical protein E2K93_17335 [Thalassotalea sp. HSM 43]
MMKSLIVALMTSITSACMVLPETDKSAVYHCAVSTELKVLKVVNITEGDTSFYEWQDEMISVITMPASAIISASYVAINNVIHIGERAIVCS